MKQLSTSQKHKMLSLIRKYCKRYLAGKYSGADESATRLMINDFLNEMLGFRSLDEVKTEYMIRGTYADYVVQIRGKRYFIVEVKAMSLNLSSKHLRQSINYAANEGIDWALLTNGKQFDLYRIIFDKPIKYRRVFSFDLSDKSNHKPAVEYLQYLTKKLVLHRGLDNLWHKASALDPINLSKLFYAKPVVNFLRRELRRSYKNKFSKDDILAAIDRVMAEEIKNAEPLPCRRRRRRSRRNKANNTPNAFTQKTAGVAVV